VSTVVPTQSPDLRFPVVVQDASAEWTAEGADINPSDPDVNELSFVPKKCADPVKVSSELANDSSPAAAQVAIQVSSAQAR
jgi:HK97 family phage major capsid protein